MFFSTTIKSYLPSPLSDIIPKIKHTQRTGIQYMLAFISHFLGDNPFTPDAGQCCKMILVEFCCGKEIISYLLP